MHPIHPWGIAKGGKGLWLNIPLPSGWKFIPHLDMEKGSIVGGPRFKYKPRGKRNVEKKKTLPSKNNTYTLSWQEPMGTSWPCLFFVFLQVKPLDMEKGSIYAFVQQ